MAVRFTSGGEIDLTPSAAPPSGADRAAAFARLLREMGGDAMPGIGPARAAGARMVAAAAGVEAATWVVRSGRVWRPVDAAPTDVVGRIRLLPMGSADWREPRVVPDAGLTFVPVQAGALAVVLPEFVGTDELTMALLEASAAAAAFTLDRAERARDATRTNEELGAVENVAAEILSLHDLDQLLLSITHRTLQLVEADMAGVMLLDGGELIMRSCTGNRSVETARLRMLPGQGVAGRVLATGVPCRVDSYLRADTITHDFNPLAETEGARSALAVPLAVHGEVVGVLEVWRRRRSVFSVRHERSLSALASLASIAIENAGLWDRQSQHVAELAEAHDTLSRQIQAMQQSASLQHSLLQLLLDGEGLPAITRTTAALVGGHVAVFSEGLEPLAAYPLDLPVDLVRVELLTLARISSRRPAPPRPRRPGTTHLPLPDGAGWLVVQAMQAGQDRLGWFCLLTHEAPSSTVVEIAVGEGALTCTLSLLEQQAASRVRVEARDEILRDLLEGSAGYRREALARAKRIHIDLSRPQRCLHGVLDGFEDGARAEGWDSARVERAQRELAGMAQRVLAAHDGGELLTVRGEAIIALVPFTEREAADRLLLSWNEELRRMLPWTRPAWGVSAAHEDPRQYGLAASEALISLRAARRMGGGRTAFFDELGVVRLLLVSDNTEDLAQYVDEVIGPILKHDRRHGTSLTEPSGSTSTRTAPSSRPPSACICTPTRCATGW